MEGYRAIALQLTTLVFLLACYASAMREWGSGLVEDLPHAAHELLRRRARTWASACALLFFLIVVLRIYVLGAVEAADWLSSQGGMLLLQVGMVIVLIPVGGAWAVRLGRSPLGGNPDSAARQPSLHDALIIFGLLAVLLGWTLLLTHLFPHHLLASLPAGFADKSITSALAGPFVMAFTTLAPIIEEILFRHYLLHRLTWALRNLPFAPAFAIIATSLAFGFAHYGSLDPYWLKVLQSGGIGVVLGVVAWRRGVEHSIALHWLFNLSLIPLGAWLK